MAALPPAPDADSWSKMFNAYGALAVTVIIFALFAWHSSDDTLKNLAVLAAGYWLGSSNSSQKKDDVTAAQTQTALAALTPTNGIPAPPLVLHPANAAPPQGH